MMLKKHFWLGLTAVLASIASVVAAPPKLIVAILVDQLRYDYLERFDSQFTTNGFRLFTRQGAFMTFAHYDYYPTVTAPGHASVFSGAPPAVHGIVGNEWFNRQTRKQVYCVEDATVSGVGTATAKGKMSPRNFMGANFSDQLRLHFGSKVVGISMKDRGAILPAGKRPAGAYWFESKSGEFITSSYYMNELPSWVRTFNSRKLPASFVGQKWDRLVDARHYRFADAGAGEGPLAGEKSPTFPHTVNASATEGFETIMPTPFGNQLMIEFARAAIEGESLGQGGQPDLLCVSFSSNDYAGHRFGPHSHEVQDITLRLDRQLAELGRYLDQKFGLGNVMMLLTADHAVAPLPEFAVQQGIESVRLNEKELLVELMTRLDEKFGPGKYFLTPNIYEGSLFLNHDTLHEKKLTVGEVFAFVREWALADGRFQACYSREQLLDGRAPGPVGQRVFNGYHPERCGDIVLITKPFVVPSSTKTGTTHGSPYAYDTHVPVAFFGREFIPGRYADAFNITDIVPTLCAALRMEEPAGSVGRPLVNALAKPQD